MKRKTVLILLLAGMLCLTGCNQKNTESGDAAVTSTGSKEIPEGAIADESGDFVYTGELKQGGDDENGYIKIPATYVSFQEVDVEGLTQYSDPTGTNIVTLDFYEGIDYETASENLYSYMLEDTTMEGLTGAIVTINGYKARQLYCYYPDDGKFLVTWLIQEPTNTANTYYLAIEFTNEGSEVMACSSTFQTPKDYADSVNAG